MAAGHVSENAQQNNCVYKICIGFDCLTLKIVISERQWIIFIYYQKALGVHCFSVLQYLMYICSSHFQNTNWSLFLFFMLIFHFLLSFWCFHFFFSYFPLLLSPLPEWGVTRQFYFGEPMSGSLSVYRHHFDFWPVPIILLLLLLM